MKDALGDRMKLNYETRFKQYLMRRAYTIIRVDGKAFHTFTKGLKRPFDDGLMEDMDNTAIELCKSIQGAKFAFVQSDEISILITDFDDLNTSGWFDLEMQKTVSISASIATSSFNLLRMKRKISESMAEFKMYDLDTFKSAQFDSRVFQLPIKQEVENCFIWRQNDATRNSISMVAQSLYSHKQLQRKNSNELQELIYQKGINWNDYDPKYKRGRIIVKENYTNENGGIRSRWVVQIPPIFTKEREYLSNLIPDNNGEYEELKDKQINKVKL